MPGMSPPMTPLDRPVRVLLVEDDVDVARTVHGTLEPMGFSISIAPDLASAERILRHGEFQAIILDLTLPDGDGLDLTSSLRSRGVEVPILMLTARDSVADRLIGFDRGADDYLGKPFDVNELAARLRVLLKWLGKGERHRLRYADLELDLLARRVRRPGLEATLSQREAELLAFFLRHPEEVLARDRILDELWGDAIEESSNLVNVYVNLLRNKIESPAHDPLIRTVRGAGYMLSSKASAEMA